MAGIRDSKTVDGVTYNYLTLDGKVVRQTWGSNVLDIIYDNSGLPYALKYNGAYYIYVLNQQGDVIRIVNSTGATVAEYRYDAWGNVIYSNGSMAAINPIRYRGYYYDTETGFYYLQSIYYDPTIGRFINADNFAFVGATSDFAGYNQFVYCGNNPISREDSSGMLWFVSVAVGMGTQYIADVLGNLADKKTGWEILKPTSSPGEYIAAGVTALIPGKGMVGAFVRNVVTEGIKVAENLHNGNGIDWCESALNIGLGTVFDAAFEKVADKVGAYIDSKMPRNYSSYAGAFYDKNPNATREQVLSSMQRAIRTNRYIADVISTGIDVVRSCLPY